MKSVISSQWSVVSGKPNGRRLAAAFAFGVLSLIPAHAQNFAIDWFTIDGGGGPCSGEIFYLDGTIGQPDAATASGGIFRIEGGFWGLFAPGVAPAAALAPLASAGTDANVAALSDSSGFDSEENPLADTSSRTDVGVPRLSIVLTTTNTVALSWPSAATGFTLQENADGPSAMNWTTVRDANISDDGTTRTLLVNPPTGHRFYRLFRP